MKKLLLFLTILIISITEVYAVEAKNNESWDKTFKKSDKDIPCLIQVLR